ncbi:hypothetical protein BCV69DRAFT_17657 [Microstroma glucosiphilum]|uniref:Uncharacterized protein n=1 Tax=Pseudomicrostroma glucosiphilum TaxID=1684307 RepID=A0A316UFK8_9BASI|nr:hypothetical protein BCV69DRAFT_17657 [Pseudomicrostroma glucosiphilum]PWN24029.1 hypothetical protein BCV69DRAFT_17657 [Pseudomicrostroma glucosiphilum]
MYKMVRRCEYKSPVAALVSLSAASGLLPWDSFHVTPRRASHLLRPTPNSISEPLGPSPSPRCRQGSPFRSSCQCSLASSLAMLVY